MGSANKNKEGGQKKDERPKERGWDAMQPNRKIVRSRMRWAGHLVSKLAKRADVEKHQGRRKRTQEKRKATAEMGGLREEGHEKIGGG